MWGVWSDMQSMIYLEASKSLKCSSIGTWKPFVTCFLFGFLMYYRTKFRIGLQMLDFPYLVLDFEFCQKHPERGLLVFRRVQTIFSNCREVKDHLKNLLGER